MRIPYSALALLLVLGCSGADGMSEGDVADPNADGGAADAGAVDETMSGEAVYQSMCASCHGAAGEGTSLGYALRHPTRAFATWVIRHGRGGDEFGTAMAAYGSNVISDEQLDEMFTWLDSFPQPTAGEDLYADYCANCHGTDPFDGGVVNKDIGGEGYSEILETAREGESVTDYGDRGEYMPAFSNSRLSDDELKQISDWIDR